MHIAMSQGLDCSIAMLTGGCMFWVCVFASEGCLVLGCVFGWLLVWAHIINWFDDLVCLSAFVILCAYVGWGLFASGMALGLGGAL